MLRSANASRPVNKHRRRRGRVLMERGEVRRVRGVNSENSSVTAEEESKGKTGVKQRGWRRERGRVTLWRAERREKENLPCSSIK